MLDFTPGDLARFREIGEVVGFPDRPPEVLTALALSGSAAQGKVQSFPGDCDYFERIHITAPTREAGVRDPGPRDAREGALDPRRPDLPAVGGQVRQLPVRRRARRERGPQGRADLLDGRRGRDRCHRRPARRRAGDPDLGRGRRRARLVQARLDRGRPQAPRPGQRVQHARRDLGGARRRDHAARRVRGPLLPGGLPGARVAAAVPEADRRAGDGLRGGLRRRSWSTRSSSTRRRTSAGARSRAGCTTSSG